MFFILQKLPQIVLGIDYFVTISTIGMGIALLIMVTIFMQKTMNPLLKWSAISLNIIYVSTIKTYLFIYLGEQELLPFLLLVTLPMGMISGPVFNLHFSAIIHHQTKLTISEWKQGIPAVILLGYGFSVLVFGEYHWLSDIPPQNSFMLIFWSVADIMLISSWIYYLYVYGNRILKLKQDMMITPIKYRSFYLSAYNFFRFHWISFAIITSLFLLNIFVSIIIQPTMLVLYLISIVLSVLIFLNGYFLIQTGNWYSDDFRPEIKKEALSHIQDISIPETLALLETLMKEKQYYLDSELTLPKLAGYLHLTPHQLSELLNVRLSTSFNDYVNSFRIQHAKELFAKPSYADWKILSIGIESGFGTKATFNSAFKKHTGMTPSEYKESLE